MIACEGVWHINLQEWTLKLYTHFTNGVCWFRRRHLQAAAIPRTTLAYHRMSIMGECCYTSQAIYNVIIQLSKNMYWDVAIK